MKFEINEYHRDISSDELIKDVKKVATELRKDSITVEEYDIYGRYNHTTMFRRLGSWKEVLTLAGLNIEQHNFKISDEEYIVDLQRVSKELKKIR